MFAEELDDLKASMMSSTEPTPTTDKIAMDNVKSLSEMLAIMDSKKSDDITPNEKLINVPTTLPTIASETRSDNDGINVKFDKLTALVGDMMALNKRAYNDLNHKIEVLDKRIP